MKAAVAKQLQQPIVMLHSLLCYWAEGGDSGVLQSPYLNIALVLFQYRFLHRSPRWV